MAIITLLGVWLVCAVFSAVVANSKGRSGANWFVLGFLFGPFAFFAVGLMPRLGEPKLRANTRLCPFCAERIQIAAIKCKHCGSAVEPTKAIGPDFLEPVHLVTKPKNYTAEEQAKFARYNKIAIAVFLAALLSFFVYVFFQKS